MEGIQGGGMKFPPRPERFKLCRYKPITAKTNDYYKLFKIIYFRSE